MSADFDLAVIGAGPGGAAAALSAARAGMRVGLFEPQALPDKPCGEGILPSGVAALRALGFETLLRTGVALERIGYLLASGAELEIALPANGCALERTALAHALTAALAGEASITRIERRADTERAGNAFRVTCGSEAWTAATLIVADGQQGEAAAWLRRARGGVRRQGLRARAELRAAMPRVEVHLGRSSEVYLTPLPGGRVNVAVLWDGTIHGSRTSAACLAAALEAHPRAAQRLGAWVTPPEVRVLNRARPRRVAEDGAFLVGDAAGGVDPVLGCGVAIALTSGLAAARAAVLVLRHGSGAPERAYARFLREETGLRRAVANGLVWLARNPGLQSLAARLLAAWPEGAERLAARIARV